MTRHYSTIHLISRPRRFSNAMVTLAGPPPIVQSSQNKTPTLHHLDPKTVTVAHHLPKQQHLSLRMSIRIPTKHPLGLKTRASGTSKDKHRTVLLIPQLPPTRRLRDMTSPTHTALIIGEVVVARAKLAIARSVVTVTVITTSIPDGANQTVRVRPEFRGDEYQRAAKHSRKGLRYSAHSWSTTNAGDTHEASCVASSPLGTGRHEPATSTETRLSGCNHKSSSNARGVLLEASSFPSYSWATPRRTRIVGHQAFNQSESVGKTCILRGASAWRKRGAAGRTFQVHFLFAFDLHDTTTFLAGRCPAIILT